MRYSLAAGALLIFLSIWLFSNEHHEIALGALALGVVLALHGGRRFVKEGYAQRDHEILVAHSSEMLARLDRGETLDQIADAFERNYQVAPSRTLWAVATGLFARMTQTNDPAIAEDLFALLSRSREENPAAPRDLITKFDARRNLFGVSRDVQIHSPVLANGMLFAARNYLYFFAIEAEDSEKEAIISRLSAMVPALHNIHLAETFLKDAAGAFTNIDDSRELKGLVTAFDSPGSFAVPWRDITWVGKRRAAGPIRMPGLVLQYTKGGVAVEQRFGLDLLSNPKIVDEWIDLVRVACALDGKLLPVDPPVPA